MDSLTTNMNPNKLKERERPAPCGVREFLEKCELPEYLESFLVEGFESLDSVYEITEEDMAVMGVKRGHRRVIQREIATAKGIPRDQPLIATIRPNSTIQSIMGGNSSSGSSSSSGGSSFRSNVNSNSSTSGYGSMSSSALADVCAGVEMGEDRSSNDEDDDDNRNHSTLPSPVKRRYRRHPKPDQNAPVKPPSAYITFSNHVRAQLKDENMSFADQAKLIGERWSNLDHEEKQRYDREATKAKDEYLATLDQYQSTGTFKEYQSYLEDFRTKQGDSDRKVKARKRAKRQFAIGSTTSRSSGSNGSSGSGSMDGYYGDNSSSLNSRRDSSNDTSRSCSSSSSTDQATPQSANALQKHSEQGISVNVRLPSRGTDYADHSPPENKTNRAVTMMATDGHGDDQGSS